MPRPASDRPSLLVREPPLRARLALLLLAALGCNCGPGPDASEGEGSHTDATTPTDGTSPGTDPTEPSTDTGTPSTDTGTPDIECWRHLDEDACLAAGCAGMVETYVVTDATSCTTRPWDRVCIGTRESTPSDPRTSFFRVLDGSTVFYPMPSCDEAPPGPFPEDAWLECAGDGGDPPACACFCAGGRCPGHWQREAMLACNLPEPCDTLFPNGGEPQQQLATARCLLQTLQTNTPAHLHVHGDYGDPIIDEHLFTRGDGTADHSRSVDDYACLDCCPSFGPALDACTLKSPTFFADCEAELDLDPTAACAFEPSQWFDTCTPTTPACP